MTRPLPSIEELQARLATELAIGEAARLTEIKAAVERRIKLGLSTICTADELDATPNLSDEIV